MDTLAHTMPCLLVSYSARLLHPAAAAQARVVGCPGASVPTPPARAPPPVLARAVSFSTPRPSTPQAHPGHVYISGCPDTRVAVHPLACCGASP
jgi:hypothetical protein